MLFNFMDFRSDSDLVLSSTGSFYEYFDVVGGL